MLHLDSHLRALHGSLWLILNASYSISHHLGPDILITAGVKASRPSQTDVLLIDGCVLMPLRAYLSQRQLYIYGMISDKILLPSQKRFPDTIGLSDL